MPLNEPTQDVIWTKAPRELARRVLRELRTDDGHPGVYWYRGSYYEWRGGTQGRWYRQDDRWMHAKLYEVLSGLKFAKESDGGATTTYTPLEVTKRLVQDVEHAMSGIIDYPYEEVPRWVVGDTSDKPDPSHCVAFKDVVVDVKETARRFAESGEYEWACHVRTPELFTLCVLPFEFNEEAECPTWRSAMHQWSGGDKVWEELRERFYGYAMMPTVKYARWLLEHGQPRAGKGEGTRLLRKMLGDPSFFGSTMRQLSGEYGLDGAEMSQVIVVGEANNLSAGRGQEVATIIKSVLGGDSLSINAKYVRQRREVVRAVPIVQSNPMPRLPNDAKGLSAKLLALSFEHSFVGKEDFGLPERLDAEIQGVALAWLKAAVRLEAEPDPKLKFVMPEGSKRVIRRFEDHSNPYDAFLGDMFLPGGSTTIEVVQHLRKAWERESGIVLPTKQGSRVSDQALPKRLEMESSWNIYRTRIGREDRRVRVIKGIKPRDLSDED